MICRTGYATGASGPTGGWRRPALGGARHNDPVGSWSLGGPSAEAVTSETKPSEEALERRTRRTHCGRPCDNPGVTVACQDRRSLSRAFSTFGPRDVMLVIGCVGQTWFFGRSRERPGGGTGHLRCWHRGTLCPEVVVCQG